MDTVAVDDVRLSDAGSDAERRSLSDVLGTTDVAINHYRLEPGDRLAGLHAHADQEEIFVVMDGTVTFETLDGESVVETGEIVRFAPGEHQSGKNASEQEAMVLALGAPCETAKLRIPVACAACDHYEQRLTMEGDSGALVCVDCGAESKPRCSACGGKDLRAILSEDGETVVSECRECGTEWA